MNGLSSGIRWVDRCVLSVDIICVCRGKRGKGKTSTEYKESERIGLGKNQGM